MGSTATTYLYLHNRKKSMQLCRTALALEVPMLHWHSQNTNRSCRTKFHEQISMDDVAIQYLCIAPFPNTSYFRDRLPYAL
jgi:hypothetical protein